MKTSPIKEAAPLFLTQLYSFNYKKKVNCKVSITVIPRLTSDPANEFFG